MMGKKEALGNLLGISGVSGLALKLLNGADHRLMVLAYHRVVDMGDEDRFLQDPELVSATVGDFERQMRFVRDHCHPLTLAEVIKHLDKRTPLPPRSVAITFDDGHIDNHTHAFPVLRELGLSACIFLSTDYIGSKHMFWFDRVAFLINAAPSGQWWLGGCDVVLDETRASRRQAAGQLLRALKRVPNQERLDVLNQLENAFAEHVQPGTEPQRSAMDWDEVREMHKAGIEFGSHTCSHPILTQLDDVGLRLELTQSRRVLERELGCSVDTIAYPVGKVGAFDEQVIAASEAAGYRLGLSYESGVNLLHPKGQAAEHLYGLKRLAVERYTSFAFFKSMLAFPALLS